MSNLRRNRVKIPLIQSFAKKFEAEMVELVLNQFGLFGRPPEWAAPCVTHVGARPRLILGMH